MWCDHVSVEVVEVVRLEVVLVVSSNWMLRRVVVWLMHLKLVEKGNVVW